MTPGFSFGFDCGAFPAGAFRSLFAFIVPMDMAAAACFFVCALDMGGIIMAAAAWGSSAAGMPAVAGNEGVLGL
jgi:hypothetical protein